MRCVVLVGVLACLLASPQIALREAAAAGAKTAPAVITLNGTIESTGQRRFVLRNSEHGKVSVFLSTHATVTGAIVPGASVRVEGTVIEDFIRTAAMEVTARVVQVEPRQ